MKVVDPALAEFSTANFFPQRTEVSNLALIAAVSFLWNAVEQKDLAESREPFSNEELLFRF